MHKIDWPRKLTSRKFWLSVIGFVTAILIAIGAGEDTTTQVTAIIAAAAQIIAYTIGEGITDAAHSETLISSGAELLEYNSEGEKDD